MTDITIRNSRPADAPALRELAALDSSTLPTGELLVAEVSGHVVAAYSPDAARAIADPFRRTADVVDMLKLRAGAVHTVREHRSRILPALRAA